LDQLKFEAAKIGGETVVITFHPHPRRVLHNAEAPSLLTSLEERIERFRIQGINHLVVVPFDPTFASMGAEEYVRDFLVKYFNPRAIVIGYDHRFGLSRQGDLRYLRWHSERFGYEVFEIEPRQVDDMTVSSTKIRKALQEGNMALSNEYLGYDYFLSGSIVKGKQLGRDKKGYMTMEGTLQLISSNQLEFTGTIISQEAIINKGKICKREGKIRFTANPKQKKWIMNKVQRWDEQPVDEYITINF
jgi:riboflavin kinase/FMN adenylyltransferase